MTVQITSHAAVPRRLLCLLGAAWAAVCMAADPPAPPAGGAVPTPQTGEDAERSRHENVAESVARGLRDIRSNDVNARRRAVLLLSKYDIPQARAAVLAALRDPDTTVRRSALVAVGEWDLPPPEAARDVLRLVADPDVQTRRLASSLLRRCLFSPGLLTLLRTVPNAGGLRRNRSVPQAGIAHSPETAGIVRKALRDPDPYVRKNILNLAPFLGRYFDEAGLRQCLKSKDTEERVLALRACRYALPPQRLPQMAADAVADPAPEVRAEVARLLSRTRGNSRELLRKLAGDRAPEVRAEAVRALLLAGDPNDWKLAERFFLDDEVPAAIREQTLSYVPFGPLTQVRALLKKLTEARSSGLRAAALRLLATRNLGKKLPASFYVTHLDDSSPQVRAAALLAIRRRAKTLDAEIVRRMASSRYDDVRKAALDIAASMPPDRAGPILEDAILDDDPQIRARAIRILGVRRAGDWQFILKQALRDPDAAVRRAAAEALLGRLDMDARTILDEYLRNPDDADLADLIRKRIALRRSRLPYGPRRTPRTTPRPPRPAPPPRRTQSGNDRP